MMMKSSVIVCDIGAGSIKIGHAGNLTPLKVVPTVVATSARDEACLLVGEKALSSSKHGRHYTCHRPIGETGVFLTWKHIAMLLEHCLATVCPGISNFRDCKILLARPNKILARDLQQLLEYFLVTKKFGAVALHDQVALTLYTHGVETGVVVDLGETFATIVPVYAGHAIPNLDRRMNIGGRSISCHMDKLLLMRGYRLDPSRNLELARMVKEEFSYVARDTDREQKLADETTVLEKRVDFGGTGTSNSSVSLGPERFVAAEVFFQPDLMDSDEPGLADVIFDLIQHAAMDCRADLYRNIILCGGSSLLPGIKDRLEAELIFRYKTKILKKSANGSPVALEVHASETRALAVFEGAALFGDLIAEDPAFWVTKEQYDQDGMNIDGILKGIHLN